MHFSGTRAISKVITTEPRTKRKLSKEVICEFIISYMIVLRIFMPILFQNFKLEGGYIGVERLLGRWWLNFAVLQGTFATH